MKHYILLNAFLFIIASAFCQDDNRLVKIPVVFHILYADSVQDNGITKNSIDSGNNTMYLPKEKIEAELADMDKDFQKLNSDTSEILKDFKKVIGNPKIHFYLKEIKYVRVNGEDIKKPFTNTDLLHQLSPAVDSKSNLNVYISKIKYEGSPTDGVTPVSISLANGDSFDAVNLDYTWVGLGYRLLTHETGHWLGLWHTWDINQQRDGINDIPLQKTYTNKPCDACPPSPNIKDQVTKRSGFKHSNYNNFMDYSGCRKMFSIKQAEKIRYVIMNFRPEIWNNSGN